MVRFCDLSNLLRVVNRKGIIILLVEFGTKLELVKGINSIKEDAHLKVLCD